MINNKHGRAIYHSADIPQQDVPIARGIQVYRGSTLSYEYGHLRLSNAREMKRKAASHSTSSNSGSVTASNANNDGNNGSDGDNGDDGGGGEDGGDDDPSDSARSLPIVYHLIFPSNFLSSLLLAGTAWLFKDSFLAAIPLIGLCALCVPDKLQFLRGEVSSQRAKFEIRHDLVG